MGSPVELVKRKVTEYRNNKCAPSTSSGSERMTGSGSENNPPVEPVETKETKFRN